MRQVTRILLVLLLLLVPATSWAQKIAVSLNTTVDDDDPVGQRYAYQLREKLAGSPLFKLVESTSKESPLYQVYFTSFADTWNPFSAISVILTRYDWNDPTPGSIFVGHEAFVAGANRATLTVERVVATLYRYVEMDRDFLAKYKALMKKEER